MGLKESGLRGSLRNVSVGIDAIPDSVVSRPADDGANTGVTNPIGLRMDFGTEWPTEIDVKTGGFWDSGNDAETAKVILLDENDNHDKTIGETDVSDVGPNEIVTIPLDETISENEKYDIVADAENDFGVGGYFDETDFPYQSDDNNISIIAGSDGGDETGVPFAFEEVGNLTD